MKNRHRVSQVVSKAYLLRGGRRKILKQSAAHCSEHCQAARFASGKTMDGLGGLPIPRHPWSLSHRSLLRQHTTTPSAQRLGFVFVVRVFWSCGQHQLSWRFQVLGKMCGRFPQPILPDTHNRLRSLA
jgi:hypothetical protein